MKVFHTIIFVMFFLAGFTQTTVVELNQPQVQTHFEVAQQQSITASGGKTTFFTAQGSVLFQQVKQKNKPPQYTLLAYPNPAQQQFTLQIPGINQPYQITLTDVTGKVVYQQTLNQATTTIPTGNLKRGLYIISANTTQTQIGHQRLLVQ